MVDYKTVVFILKFTKGDVRLRKRELAMREAPKAWILARGSQGVGFLASHPRHSGQRPRVGTTYNAKNTDCFAIYNNAVKVQAFLAIWSLGKSQWFSFISSY